MSGILDDAREKIAKELYLQSFNREAVDGIAALWEGMHGYWQNKYLEKANQILAISGTTDIECPDCRGSGKAVAHGLKGSRSRTYKPDACPKCDNGVIKHEWEMGVHLKNGELPSVKWAMTGAETPSQATKISNAYREAYKEYRQVVE